MTEFLQVKKDRVQGTIPGIGVGDAGMERHAGRLLLQQMELHIDRLPLVSLDVVHGQCHSDLTVLPTK